MTLDVFEAIIAVVGVWLLYTIDTRLRYICTEIQAFKRRAKIDEA